MSYLEAGTLAQDYEFRLKVKIALISAAKDIASEEETNFIAYAKRHPYAVSILNDPDAKLSAFAFAVTANPVVNAGSSDSDLQYTVNTVFDSLAGVKPSDRTTEI